MFSITGVYRCVFPRYFVNSALKNVKIRWNCLMDPWSFSIIKTLNSCVLFCLLEDKRLFFGLPDQKIKSNIKKAPETDGGFFEAIKNFSKHFLTEVWPEVSQKIIGMTSRLKLYEFEQHPHAISFCQVLVVH